MKSATSLPYDWLKEIPTSLLQMDEIPLFGHPPSFPWAEFASKLASVFQIEQLEINLLGSQWRPAEEILEGLGGSPIATHISLPGLDGTLCWLFPEADIKYLVSLLIGERDETLDILDPELEKGFIDFLTYEVFQVFNQCNFDKTLNPHLLDEASIPTEASLCSDISIKVNERTFVGRLVLSQVFHKAWKEKYAVRTLDIPMESVLAQKIEITVPIVAGSTSLKLGEWKRVRLGDFISLDYCSIDPTSDRGRVTLTVNDQPFYRARLKDGNLKILEHPLYFEAEASMAKQELPPEEPKEEEFEETEFDLDEGEQDSLDDDEEESEDEEESDEAVESILAQAEKRIQGMDEHEEPSAEPSARPVLQPDEIPLSIVVEVGRLQMSVQKLLDLQPGNLLELNVRPETGVDLVVNGRRIGKGELLRIGDVLGVRILDIG